MFPPTPPPSTRTGTSTSATATTRSTSLGPDGLRIWTYNNGHEGDINASPAIAADGTIYFSFIQNLSGFGVVAAISQNPATRPSSR